MSSWWTNQWQVVFQGFLGSTNSKWNLLSKVGINFCISIKEIFYMSTYLLRNKGYLSNTNSWSMAESKVISVHIFGLFIGSQPSLRTEFIRLGTKDRFISMNSPCMDTDFRLIVRFTLSRTGLRPVGKIVQQWFFLLWVHDGARRSLRQNAFSKPPWHKRRSMAS